MLAALLAISVVGAQEENSNNAEIVASGGRDTNISENGGKGEGESEEEDEYADPFKRSLHWEGWVEEQLEEEHKQDSLTLLLAVALLIVVVLTIWVFKLKRCRVMHETGFSIFYGELSCLAKKYGSV